MSIANKFKTLYFTFNRKLPTILQYTQHHNTPTTILLSALHTTPNTAHLHLKPTGELVYTWLENNSMLYMQVSHNSAHKSTVGLSINHKKKFNQHTQVSG